MPWTGGLTNIPPGWILCDGGVAGSSMFHRTLCFMNALRCIIIFSFVPDSHCCIRVPRSHWQNLLIAIMSSTYESALDNATILFKVYKVGPFNFSQNTLHFRRSNALHCTAVAWILILAQFRARPHCGAAATPTFAQSLLFFRMRPLYAFGLAV